MGISLRSHFGVLLCMAASLGAGGCKKANLLSTSDEIKIGREGAQQIERQYRVDATSADAQRVRRIGERLLSTVPHRDVPYSFKVLDTAEINAVSLPGGPVYVYRGLLNLVGSDDNELAAVMAHEVGHVEARHAARQISTQIQAQALIQLLLKGGTAQELAGLGAQLLSLRYSRDDEYEADSRALNYAYRAGFDPRGLIEFFRKLQEREKGGGAPELLRTHPLTGDRITRAERILESGSYKSSR